jgi:hypothetical protein
LENIALSLGIPLKDCEKIFGQIRECFEDAPCLKLRPDKSKAKAKAKPVAVPETPTYSVSAPSTPATVAADVWDSSIFLQDTEGYRSASQTDNISCRETDRARTTQCVDVNPLVQATATAGRDEQLISSDHTLIPPKGSADYIMCLVISVVGVVVDVVDVDYDDNTCIAVVVLC